MIAKGNIFAPIVEGLDDRRERLWIRGEQSRPVHMTDSEVNLDVYLAGALHSHGRIQTWACHELVVTIRRGVRSDPGRRTGESDRSKAVSQDQ